ncbi:hypothetical protein [Pseudonocardia sp. GCM10023141]|uniref:hypothetical protein n=1 Tax=Pseudonocardia sp. GCM10023141 TaxID=3252653 RepID=UPI0036075656
MGAEGVHTPSVPEPELPDGITAAELDAEARRDLRGLQKDTADMVARHLVAAGRLVDEDPEQALEHARFARKRASRIALVREAAGIAAYHAGEWAEALGELRAARRMGGGPGHLAVMADIERALGRPERALELARGPEVKELDRSDMIELTIVVAGARRDLGELDAAVVGLQIPELDATKRDPWSVRLFYAYADNLLAAGRESDALQWFVHTVDADVRTETDATERIAELTGEELPDDGVEFDVEDEEPSTEIDSETDAAVGEAPAEDEIADAEDDAEDDSDSDSDDVADSAADLESDEDVEDIEDVAAESTDDDAVSDSADVPEPAVAEAGVAEAAAAEAGDADATATAVPVEGGQEK